MISCSFMSDHLLASAGAFSLAWNSALHSQVLQLSSVARANLDLTLSHAWASSTSAKYQSSLNIFLRFCDIEQVLPTSVCLQVMIFYVPLPPPKLVWSAQAQSKAISLQLRPGTSSTTSPGWACITSITSSMVLRFFSSFILPL